MKNCYRLSGKVNIQTSNFNIFASVCNSAVRFETGHFADFENEPA